MTTMASDLSWNAIAGLMAGWLLTYALHSTLLLILAWSLTRLGIFASHQTAEVLWKVATLGGLITASLQTLAMLGIVPLGEHLNVTGVAATGLFRAIRHTAPVPSQGEQFTAGVNDSYLSYLSGPDWPVWVCGLWALGACLGMARCLINRQRLEMYLWRCKRRPVVGTPVALMLRRLCRTARLRYRVRLTTSSRLLSPIALEHREICVPARAITDLSAKQQESMLAHELAHIARHDPAWRLAAEIIQALFFFQPLNIFASRQLKEIAEYLCDDWAVRQTGRHLSLAQCLTEVATWIQQQAQPLGAVGLTGKRSLLVDRVSRLVERREPRRTNLSALWGGLIMIVLLLIILGLLPVVSVFPPITVTLAPSFGIGADRVFYIQTGNDTSAGGTFQQSIPAPINPPAPPPAPPNP